MIFDFLNDNNLAPIDSRGVFQFYPMVNLWPDIETALAAGLRSCTSPPSRSRSPRSPATASAAPSTPKLPGRPARYDFRSRHAAAFGADGPYQYSRRETLLAIRAYAQSEPRTVKP